MTALRELTVETFKTEVIDADRPVLVDFYADWCGPCQAQAPMLEKLASRFAGTAIIFKVNVDRSPELNQLFEVRAIPTMVLFSNGKLARRFTGLTQGRELTTAILACLEEGQP